jgi:uncharacterized protein (TIGR03437 family)
MRSEKIIGYFACFCLASFVFTGTASATVYIGDVVNAGSRIGSGLPGYGIAQGALFAVTGQNVGPAQSVQATFPLPTDAGLAGVTVTINVAGSTAPAIMVYVSANEVDAILPSGTPLGTGTVTVNNNGDTATAPLTVVASAFGIFTSLGNGYGGALAFNVNSDGSNSQNAALQSAQSGQTIMLNGTGLGAIQSDETQSGDTDVPNVSVTVWVGSAQAAVTSAARGTCCSGLNPSFPIPPGIAAWDIISFVVPDGVAGCQVSVAVQIGNQVSNLAPIAVAPGGGACPELAALNLGDFQTLQNPYKQGLVTMTRVVTNAGVGAASTVITSDSGSAQFFQIDLGMPVQVSDVIYSAYLKAAAGSCMVILSRFDRSNLPPPTTPPAGPQPVTLDAGPVINVVDPDITQAMPNKKNLYSAGAVITSISLPGSGPITTGGPGFVEPGTFTLNNGAGGADIAGFSVSAANPQPVTPAGFDQLTSITRGQDLPLKWTGGDPNGYMEIGGSAVSTQGTVTYGGTWNCLVHTGDGQFTVPGFVTAGLPPVSSPTPGAAGVGVINFTPIIIQFVQIPGVDLTNYISTWSIGKGVAYK